MAESFIPESIGRHGVDLSNALTDPTGSVKALHSLAWKLDEQIKAAQSITPSGEKVAPAFDVKAKADEKAAATARKMVNAILTMVAKEVEANPHVAWWLSEMDKQVTQFNTSEVNFYRWETDKLAGVKKDTSNDAVAGLKSDRRDVVAFTKKLIGLLPTVMDELPSEMKRKSTKTGETQIVLPNIQGRGAGGDTDSPAGKFASLSFMVFTVNDETFPVGTDSRIVLRAVFTGADRIGKRPGDLYDAMIAANGGNTPKTAGDTVEFTLGGKKVRAIRTSLTADELPDMPDADDSEESEDE